jgi:hypoxanthine phosphoribosyltransferase
MEDVMKEEINVLIEEEQIQAKIQEIAAQINRDYEGREIILLCILKGSVYFTCELSKYITVPLKLGFLSVSSYGDGMTSSGAVSLNGDLDFDAKGKDIIVIEDVVDSGRTLAYLLHMLAKRKPKSLKLCTLLNKPKSRVTDVKVDYVGFELEDKFVVGFGMDYAQKYRNLPYIGELVFKEGK